MSKFQQLRIERYGVFIKLIYNQKMRLYLSSRRFGKYPKELCKLVGINKHAGIILNAGDDVGTDRRRMRLEKQSILLSELGFTSEEIDLRKFFGKVSDLRDFMKKFGLVWVRGGNVFFLKRAYEQSGFDFVIKEMLEKDIIVYAGDSAGAVIAGPTIRGLELSDFSTELPGGYKTDFSVDGLGLIDYVIVPHYKSNHPESAIMENVIDFFEDEKIPYKTLRDGGVIVVDGGGERVLN